MTFTDGKESAYPLQAHNSDGPGDPEFGLTKRELFAAMALQGILASPFGGDRSPRDDADLAVSMADRLIHSLNGGG